MEGEPMKRLILGFIIGVAALAVFLYFGGAAHIKTLGKKTYEAGARLEELVKDLRGIKKNARDIAEKSSERVKEYMP
jgi:hypothetical protein